MSAPVPLRRDFGGSQLRGLAKKAKDISQRHAGRINPEPAIINLDHLLECLIDSPAQSLSRAESTRQL
jgi:hypothetical protein